ncbi:MAG: MBL fold metallo-hydrolase [Clostridia bacterium]|nr:MBL fold metallo-hydrolase [Clostridia bacterium]
MKRRNKSSKKINIILSLIILIITAIAGATLNQQTNEASEQKQNKKLDQEAIGNAVVTEITTDLKVYFIDVGQADSILIQNEEKNMLIDAGNNKDGRKLVKYFKDLGINRFDIIVGTHPHEDHIGGLDNIINNFEIGSIYMPRVSTTTVTFEDVIDAISNKNLKVTTPIIGDNFKLGECDFTILSTGTDVDNLNEASIVLKMKFGEKAFIFTGDANEKNEKEMLKMDIKADVLKVGHHGSRTSTSKEFLEKVNPTYAIISSEKENSYEHPHKETLEKLKDKSVNVYRTDENGTILIITDGKEIEIQSIKTDTNG